MERRRAVLASLIFVLLGVVAACGDDDGAGTTAPPSSVATTTTAGTTTTAATATTTTAVPTTTTTTTVPSGLDDTFDGTSMSSGLFPGTGYTLNLSEAGVAHFITDAPVAGTIPLVLYPAEYTATTGTITIRFRQGAVAPIGVLAGFWKASDFSQSAYVLVGMRPPGDVELNWYDATTGASANAQLVASLEGIYDPTDFNTLVVRLLASGSVAVELNGHAIAEAPVPISAFTGEVYWGMISTVAGEEVIVDEFSVTPGP